MVFYHNRIHHFGRQPVTPGLPILTLIEAEASKAGKLSLLLPFLFAGAPEDAIHPVIALMTGVLK
jgi:hypothetical protein